MESVVFFFVLLFLSLLAFAIRWLNERIRREIAFRDLKDLFSPSGDSPEPPARKAPETTRIVGTKSPRSLLTSGAPVSLERRLARSRLRLRNRTELRQGIVIMTVLGPCRALEHPDD